MKFETVEGHPDLRSNNPPWSVVLSARGAASCFMSNFRTTAPVEAFGHEIMTCHD